MQNKILSITRNIIPYVKELRNITGSVTSSILMQQLDYWFNKYPDGFYKFLESCNHESYKEGDSWTEELGFSSKEFRCAFDNIGIRYTSKTKFEESTDKFKGKFYASWIDKINHKTYYIRNHNIVDAALDNVISGDYQREYREITKGNTDNTETTAEITPYIKRNIKEKDNISFREPIKTKKVKLFLPEKKLFTLIEEKTPNYVSKEIFREFIKNRIAKKKQLSEYAFKLMISKLEKLHKSGEDVNECINQSILNGWDGVFSSKNKSSGKNDVVQNHIPYQTMEEQLAKYNKFHKENI